MKKILIGCGFTLVLFLSFLAYNERNEKKPDPHQVLIAEIQEFLENKNSPMAEYTTVLLEQKHWKLLIAISAIESQYCKRKIASNCFGLGGDSAYRKYNHIGESIIDANNLIEKWQSKGKWLTVESMNGSWVVPENPNWVKVVNSVLKEMELYESNSKTIHK